jgi:hypothetical protein
MNCDIDLKVGHIYYFIDSYNEKSVIFWRHTNQYSEDYKENLKIETRTTFSEKYNLTTTSALSSLFIIEKFTYQDKIFINSRVSQWRNQMNNHNSKLDKQLPDIPKYLVELANDYREHRNENKQKTILVTDLFCNVPSNNPLISNVHTDEIKVKKNNSSKTCCYW